MSPEQFVSVLGAIVAAIVAIGGVYVRILQVQQRIDGRMDELLRLAQRSAHAEGMLEAIPLVPQTLPPFQPEPLSSTGGKNAPDPPVPNSF